MDISEASAEDFQPFIDESFSIDGGSAKSLTLTDVESKPGLRESGRQPFALIFRSTGNSILPQQIYCLEHASTGKIDIFLVPIAQGEDHVLYEAVFT